MTIYDISKRAGVSIATVSRVINGSKSVSKKTREKVLKVIAECGYTPNVFARGLGLNTMRTIGILCSDISDIFMAQAISYLEKGLRDNGYDSFLCCTGPLMKNRQKGLDLLMSKHVDGVLFVGSDFVGLEMEQNRYIIDAAEKAPMMILNASLEGPNIYSAYCDDRLATMEAAQYLLRAGKRRVLYMLSSRSFSGTRKLTGYKEAHMVENAPLDEALVVECAVPNDVYAAKGQIASLAQSGLVFDAVLAATDDLAVGALKYAHEAGLNVPGQLQVIGYNNSFLCQCTEPELSSVDNKLQSICQTCVTTLMGAISGEEMPKKSIFSGELVHRGTTIKAGG